MEQSMTRRVLSTTIYPVYLFVALGLVLIAINQSWDYKITQGIISAFVVLSLLILEARLPLEKRWAMTWLSFKRDLKYMAAGISLASLSSFVGPFFALYLAVDGTGPALDWPLLPSVLVLLLSYEFLQYWYHRLSHELSGPVGQFLWRVHAAHHLPDRVYVLMHAVSHPLNFLAVRWLIYALVVYIPGFSVESVLVLGAIMSINGTFSHFNMDIRAGVLNYIFISTELHRYHHSADFDEAKNYGALTPFWDLVFGTFVYKPGHAPARIGVDLPEAYPDSNEFWKVMAFPFHSLDQEKYDPVRVKET